MPSTLSGHAPEGDDVESAGIGRGHPAEGGAASRGEVDAERETGGRAGGPGDRSRTTPAPTRTEASAMSTSSTPQSREVEMTTSPDRGTEPPTSDVLPPWGTTGTRPTRTSTGRGGLHRSSPAERRRVSSPRQRDVQSVVYERVRCGVDEDVVRTDDDVSPVRSPAN